MDLEEIIMKLKQNDKEVTKKTAEILLRVVDDILKKTSSNNGMTLKKTNNIVCKNILEVNGATHFLNFIGFIEDDEGFHLKTNFKVSVMNIAKMALIELTEMLASPVNSSIDLNTSIMKKYHHQNNQKSVTLPPLVLLYQHTFLNEIERQFHRALVYEDKELQEKAKKLIPLKTLQVNAQERLQALEEALKNGEIKQLKVSVQEMLLLELLQWFKDDFFSWVNQPNCDFCGGKTEPCNSRNFENFFIHTKNVEHYLCRKCNQVTPFPRHNNLHVLLETRCGRCGEWANTFTLFCRAMGWDARFVMDWSDHVWVEVYSTSQQRWLHCDPCENVCDKPLLYESGWKKAVTYVMAFSADEVQDVAWRYSSKHRDVLKRRHLCSENLLVSALMQLRSQRQKNYSESKRQFLQARVLNELIELLVEKTPETGEMIGRQSGDLVWRLKRRETEITPNHIWIIDLEKLKDNIAVLKYSVSKDSYKFKASDEVSDVKKWDLGTFRYSNIFRKEEKDWKQVYLARRDGNNTGTITWSFEIINGSSKQLDEIEVNFSYTTFENGNVTVTLNSGDLTKELPKDSKLLRTPVFHNRNKISLTAILSGGKGDVSWQHAQLFRQSIESNDFSFTICFYFK